MALTKITQGVIKSNENYNTHNINSTGIITATGVIVNGDLNVSGVLTYDDVTNIDSVGIITAQSGIHVTGGNVGIGTDNPISPIHIVGTNGIKIDDSTNGKRAEFRSKNDIVEINGYDPSNGNAAVPIVLKQYTNERLRITSAGLIGIGTVSPSGPIHAHVASGTQRSYLEASAAHSFLRLKSGSTSYNSGLEFFSGASNIANINGLGAGGLQFEVNGSERLRITSDGHVGIGTDAVDSHLTVAAPSATARLELRRTNAAGTGSYGAINFTALDSHSVASIYASGDADGDDNGADIVFRTTSAATTNDAYTAGAERLRITSDGDIEIQGDNGGFVAPSRRTISSVVRYGTGIQYRDTSGNHRPILHIQAYSRGLGTNSRGSNSVYVNGVAVRTTGRSWGLTVISGGGSNIGQVLHSQTYDVYVSTGAATSLINDMATYDTNYNILIVNTYDEPANNGGTIRSTLKGSYYAKHAESSTHRYAYVHAWRNQYGLLGECHSATRNGSTFTNQGNNGMANAGISFTVIL